MKRNTPDWKNSAYLLKKTGEVLNKLAELQFLSGFTLVGGSALAFYLKHRLSEDLDFFSWKADLPKKEIFDQLQNLFGNNFTLITDTTKQLDFSIHGVKVTFFANDWKVLKKERTSLKDNLHIGTLELLTGMKINTLFLRAKYRDYYDLYTINKEHFSIKKMYQIIAPMMPQINRRLFQMAMSFTDDIEDESIQHLKPRIKITKEEIGKHFQKEIFDWLKN